MNCTQLMIADQLRNLGVKEGDHLNVKVSLKSIGLVKGGARTVIDALLQVVGTTGTIFTDAFISAYPLPLNAVDRTKVAKADSKSYAGALANEMIKHPMAFRSPHPIQKFVGIGFLAQELTSGHTIESPAYELLGKLADRGGRNLKIGDNVKVPGVGTTHVAIERLGVILNHPPRGVMYETPDGKVELFEVFWSGGCSHAWLKYYPAYEEIGAILGSGAIGMAPAMLTDMACTLDWELQKIKEDPKSLLCGRETCKTCALYWSFSHKNRIRWMYHRLISLISGKHSCGNVPK